ncbi:hypothetical protein [Branchiibius sp. NY16-3462-2]|uniref:hypothetical protein n=1 Tax=Branchiibius sp. NY16-3462-2 TaxID=1807500 RepID=UPI0007914ED8|nr:hypothetical protein [Branchiibius sp. NY16-3462-2]KYH45463.1 hypothetical protein AZH51_00685 [Branchiibius sp. NY16-3462-2]
MESDRARPLSRWTGAFGVGLTAGLAGALCLAASSLLGSLLQPNNLGWSGLVRMATLVLWPWSDDGHPLPNFVVALLVVLLVPVILVSPAAREVTPGRFGYTMMWATWGVMLVAGALAGAAAVVITAAGSPTISSLDVLPSGLQAGAGWALLVGWIPALIAAGVHAGRLRQDVAD